MKKIWNIIKTSIKKVWLVIGDYGWLMCKVIILVGCSACACYAGLIGVLLGILNICLCVNPVFMEYQKISEKQ